jgi:hypothetical protein
VSRVYTLRLVSYDGLRDDPHSEVIDEVTIESRECTTVPEMVDQFNRLLSVMGFMAQVDVVEKDE